MTAIFSSNLLQFSRVEHLQNNTELT